MHATLAGADLGAVASIFLGSGYAYGRGDVWGADDPHAAAVYLLWAAAGDVRWLFDERKWPGAGAGNGAYLGRDPDGLFALKTSRLSL